jgi:hypothetical protein
MIGVEASRSEQVRFAAGFLAVVDLASKVLARQPARTCVCSLRPGKDLREGKAADPQKRSALRAVCKKKNSFFYVQSRNVFENKGAPDTMPEQKQTFRS